MSFVQTQHFKGNSCKVTLLRCLLLALLSVPSFVRPACGRVWALGWGQVSGTCPAPASLSVRAAGWLRLSGPQFPPVQRGAGFCTQRSRPHQPFLTVTEAPSPAPVGSLGPHTPVLVCGQAWHGAASGPVRPPPACPSPSVHTAPATPCPGTGGNGRLLASCPGRPWALVCPLTERDPIWALVLPGAGVLPTSHLRPVSEPSSPLPSH